MPTIGAFIQLLPNASTDTRIARPMEPSIPSSKGMAARGLAKRRLIGPRDVFVAPSWLPVSHHADEDSVLFSFSDRPVQQALGLWRESMV
jgi:gentisate 1,2-dioxygenase